MARRRRPQWAARGDRAEPHVELSSTGGRTNLGRVTMREMNNKFGATLDGFSAVSGEELMQVEGGSFWSKLKTVAKVVAAVAGAVVVILGATKGPTTGG